MYQLRRQLMAHSVLKQHKLYKPSSRSGQWSDWDTHLRKLAGVFRRADFGEVQFWIHPRLFEYMTTKHDHKPLDNRRNGFVQILDCRFAPGYHLTWPDGTAFKPRLPHEEPRILIGSN